LVCGVLTGILALLQAWYVSVIVARVFLDRQPLERVSDEVGLLLIAAVARAGVIFAGEVAAGHLAARVKADLRSALFAHLLALGPVHARGERTGELASVAADGVEALDAYFSQYLPQVASAVVIPVLLIAVVFGLDPLSAVVLALTAPLIPVFMVLIGRTAEVLTRRQYDLLGRLSAVFLDVLRGLTTTKIFGRSRAQIEMIRQTSEQYRSATMAVLRVAFISALALETLASIGTALVAVGVGLRLLHGRLDFQTGLFVLLLAPEVYQPLRHLGARFHGRAAALSASRRIFAVLETPVAQRAEPEWAARGPEAMGRPPTVVFRDVHYAYDGDREALRGASFEIPAGSIVALVGPSGAGKSTVADLLLRFIRPDRGEILVDGVPLDRFPVRDWRQQIAWVPQRPYIFHDTVAANLRVARADATMDDLTRAARMAHVDEVICALPRGYETVLGERGARLSAGQAQRLALARAFLKPAPFLILDEPTAAVDPDLETLLVETLLRSRGTRTVLIIAHRLATVAAADRIAVMDGGRVVESGTRAALEAQDGVYRRLLTAHREGIG
jgi:thiol reductant ABC exporter CydD subunit